LLHSTLGQRQGFFREQVMCLGIISQLQIRSIVDNDHFIQKVNIGLLRRISIAGNARALFSLGCNHLLEPKIALR